MFMLIFFMFTCLLIICLILLIVLLCIYVYTSPEFKHMHEEKTEDDDDGKQLKVNVASKASIVAAAHIYTETNEEAIEIDELMDDMEKRHNHYRGLHNVPLLKLSKKLNGYAAKWARHLIDTGTFNHRPDFKYGENLYTTTGTNKVNGKQAVDLWYNEIQKYDFSRPGFSEDTGHFTQVIWKSTKEVGCAFASDTTTKRIVVVCNYFPPGNVDMQYETNVVAPAG